MHSVTRFEKRMQQVYTKYKHELWELYKIQNKHLILSLFFRVFWHFTNICVVCVLRRQHNGFTTSLMFIISLESVLRISPSPLGDEHVSPGWPQPSTTVRSPNSVPLTDFRTVNRTHSVPQPLWKAVYKLINIQIFKLRIYIYIYI